MRRSLRRAARDRRIPFVQEAADRRRRIEPSKGTSSAVAAFFTYELERDVPRVALPRPEVQLVVRIGSAATNGLDVHAFGARQRAHRKLLKSGTRSVTARLRLGASEAVLGVPATSMTDRIVDIADLWGEKEARRLCDRLAAAHDNLEAASVLESAIAERLTRARSPNGAELAIHAAERLERSNVTEVAGDLGVSERHLRRIFRDAVGVSPKAFAKLARFHRALHAARRNDGSSWASIAASSGYYDQAHLIAEFRAIAGVTPRALLGELRDAR